MIKPSERTEKLLRISRLGYCGRRIRLRPNPRSRCRLVNFVISGGNVVIGGSTVPTEARQGGEHLSGVTRRFSGNTEDGEKNRFNINSYMSERVHFFVTIF